jgi:hypothetical protein
MKKRLLAFGAAALLFTGCGSALKVSAPEGGSLSERVLKFQESILAIVASSSTPAAAATRIEKYCAKHQADFVKLSEDARGLEGDFGAMMKFAAELMKGVEDLAKRGESDLKGKEAMLDSEEVKEAVATCNVHMPGMDGGEGGEGMEGGGQEGGELEMPTGTEEPPAEGGEADTLE